jgi:hypothetical protein
MGNPHARYPVLLAVALALPALGLAALNAVVDPFGIYRGVEIEELDPYRRWQRIAIAEGYRHEHPGVVLLGSSRVGRGLPREHPAWTGERALDMALYGGLWVEQSSALDFMLRSPHAPGLLAYGIDFFVFAQDGEPRGEFPLSRFSADHNEARYHFQSLLGMHATRESLDLLERAARRRAHGTDLEQVVQRKGNGHMFRVSLERALTSDAAPPQTVEGRVEQLGRLLEGLSARGVRVVCFVPPVHALHLEALAAAGHWERFEGWKRRLARLPVGVWDFAGYSQIAREPVPPVGELDRPMRWFYDSGHFTPEVGRAVLDRALGGESALGGPDFGLRLEPANVEARLREIRAERARWREAHPDELTRFFGPPDGGPTPQRR